MFLAVAVNFINLFVFAFNFILLGRVVLSWFNPTFEGRVGRILFDLTEPVLIPIRHLLPRTQMLDFSPLVAFLLLELLSGLANWIAGG